MWQQLNRLFSVPKGFGKFYPKGASKHSKKTTGGEGLGGSGGGGGGGGRPNFVNEGKFIIAFAGVTFVLSRFAKSAGLTDSMGYGRYVNSNI